MKAWELLVEGEKSSLNSDVEDLLIAAKASDLTELDTEAVVAQLNNMGHSVTADSLIDILDELKDKYIKTTTVSSILLKDHTGGEDGGGDEEHDEWDETPGEHTARLAKKSAMHRVRDRAKQQRKTSKDLQL